MKNNKNRSLGRQLVSGMVYTALACVIVAFTVNTTVGLFSGSDTNIPDSTIENLRTDLPEIPDIPKINLPEIPRDFTNVSPSADEKELSPVSDSPEGISSELSDAPVPESIQSSDIIIPDNANLGFDKFIKPCDGYVSKEHSADVPVYCATLSDYRTHIGVDVTGEIGTPVCAVNGGVIKSIYDDDLYGKTVCTENKDGYTIKYSNLLPTLNANITVGAIVTTGQTIGGIGETALCEAVDAPHLHLEIYDSDGNSVDPEDLISF